MVGGDHFDPTGPTDFDPAPKIPKEGGGGHGSISGEAGEESGRMVARSWPPPLRPSPQRPKPPSPPNPHKGRGRGMGAYWEEGEGYTLLRYS